MMACLKTEEETLVGQFPSGSLSVLAPTLHVLKMWERFPVKVNGSGRSRRNSITSLQG